MIDFFVKLLSPIVTFLANLQGNVLSFWGHHGWFIFFVAITLGAIFTYLINRSSSMMADNFIETIGMGYALAGVVIFLLFMASMIFALLILIIVVSPLFLYAAAVFGACVVIGKLYKHIKTAVHKSVDDIFPEL